MTGRLTALKPARKTSDDRGVDVLIEPGLAVEVILDGGWRMPAVVDTVADEHVDLSLGADGGRAAMLPAGLCWCKARIAWPTRTGHETRDGMVTVQPDGHLRLHSIGRPGQLQRRSHVRVPADLVAAVIGDAERCVTRTLDISVGGMLLSPATPVEPDQLVRFAIGVGETTVTGVGEVVRRGDDGASAIRFAELPEQGERALSEFVEQRLQADRDTVAA